MIAVGSAVAIVVAALLGSATGTPGRSGATRPRPGASPLLTIPGALRGYTVVYADHDLSVLRLDGQGQRVIPGVAVSGYPDVPVRVGESVVFVQGGVAYRIGAPFTGPAQALGPADHVFPVVAAGQVGLARGAPAGPLTVQEISVATGAAAGPLARPARLPAGYQPVAGVDTGVLVEQPLAPDVGESRLAVWQPAGGGRLSRILGPAGSVIAVHGATVAWRSAGPCRSATEGELHVTDTTTGIERVLAAPTGQCGFDGGGALSPDGRTLAAFVDAAPTAGPNAQLTLIDMATLTPTIVAGGVVPVGEPIGSAVWTPDGTIVLFGGASCSGPPGGCVGQPDSYGGPLLAYHLGDGSAVPLFIPSSYCFTVL